MKTINRLKIKWDKGADLYAVYTPDGRRQEEFSEIKGAVEFCESTFDFLTPLGKKRAQTKASPLYNYITNCDTCNAGMTLYAYKKGQGLCPDCIRHIN